MRSPYQTLIHDDSQYRHCKDNEAQNTNTRVVKTVHVFQTGPLAYMRTSQHTESIAHFKLSTNCRSIASLQPPQLGTILTKSSLVCHGKRKKRRGANAAGISRRTGAAGTQCNFHSSVFAMHMHLLSARYAFGNRISAKARPGARPQTRTCSLPAIRE